MNEEMQAVPPPEDIAEALTAYQRLTTNFPMTRGPAEARRALLARLERRRAPRQRRQRLVLISSLAGGLLLVLSIWRIESVPVRTAPLVTAKPVARESSDRVLLHTLSSGTRVYVVLPSADISDRR